MAARGPVTYERRFMAGTAETERQLRATLKFDDIFR
jgi:hypothetical protein